MIKISVLKVSCSINYIDWKKLTKKYAVIINNTVHSATCLEDDMTGVKQGLTLLKETFSPKF